ncbi:MAG: DUF5998 family protein [Arachnia sp.]
MTSSAPPTLVPAALGEQIADGRFYPELVKDTIVQALGEQPVVGFLVHHEPTFSGHEVQRHMTVLVLTQRVLLICHTDDGDPDRALSTAEVVTLRSIDSVIVTRSLNHPERYPAGAELAETWLSIAWGGARRLDLGPAECEDPTCEAEHGYTGMLVPNDITLRMSPAGDGASPTQRLLDFGALLQQRIG